MGGCLWVICKCYTILHKGLQHSEFGSLGGLGTNLLQISKDNHMF